MNRKQVEFAFRVLRYSQIEANESSASWSQYIKDNYLDMGWEVQRTEIALVQGNEIFLGVTLVRYEDVSDIEPVLESVRKRASAS